MISSTRAAEECGRVLLAYCWEGTNLVSRHATFDSTDTLHQESSAVVPIHYLLYCMIIHDFFIIQGAK